MSCWAIVCLSLAGCESEVSSGDLGKVVFEVPKVPGAKEPYKLPELQPHGGKSPPVATSSQH
jgi:hypothetical protein